MVNRLNELGRVMKEMSLDSIDPDPDLDGLDGGVGATTAPVSGKRIPRHTSGPPEIGCPLASGPGLGPSGGQHGGTPVNYRGKQDSWRTLINNLYVFGMNRALPVPAHKKIATQATASGQPRDRTARGWGWKLIRESLCPLGEFDRHLATILQSTEIAEAKLEAADQFELVFNSDGKKTHRCLHCKKCVIGRGDFNKHYRTHTNHKPYTCRAKKGCCKRFGDASTRVRHERTHLKERFECKHCKFQYTRKDNRDRHELKCKGEKRSGKSGGGGARTAGKKSHAKAQPPRRSGEMHAPDVAAGLGLPTLASIAAQLNEPPPTDHPKNRASMESVSTIPSRGSFVLQTELAAQDAFLQRERDIETRALQEFGPGGSMSKNRPNDLAYQPGLNVAPAALANPFPFLAPPAGPDITDLTDPSQSLIFHGPAQDGDAHNLNPVTEFRNLLMQQPEIAVMFPRAFSEVAATPADQIATLPEEHAGSFATLWRQFSEEILPNLQQQPRQTLVDRIASLTDDSDSPPDDAPESSVPAATSPEIGHTFEQLKSMVDATTEAEVTALQNGVARAMSLDERPNAAHGHPVAFQPVGSQLVESPLVERDANLVAGTVDNGPIDRDMSLDILSYLEAVSEFGQ